jgi:DNA-binding Lrp family transcriptional regulator
MPLSDVLINLELGSEDEVLKEFRKVSNVKEYQRLYGIYDMIPKVEADSMDTLKQVVKWKIRRLAGVRSTVTTVAIE